MSPQLPNFMNEVLVFVETTSDGKAIFNSDEGIIFDDFLKVLFHIALPDNKESAEEIKRKLDDARNTVLHPPRPEYSEGYHPETIPTINFGKRRLAIYRVPVVTVNNDLINAIRNANTALKSLSKTVTDRNFKSISLNWYTGGQAGRFPDGGPGKQRKPAKAPSDKKHAGITVSALSEPGDTLVDVFILDAFPTQDAFKNKVADLNKLESPHLLIDLDSSGMLRWYDSTKPYKDGSNPPNDMAPIAMPPLSDGTLPDHNYPMSDHGIFIAGIIHSIAKNKARLHLIPVLNDYGIGSVLSFSQGIELLYRVLQANPLISNFVVNMSLDYGLPTHYILSKNDAMTAEDRAEYAKVDKEWRDLLKYPDVQDGATVQEGKTAAEQNAKLNTDDGFVSAVDEFVTGSNQGVDFIFQMMQSLNDGKSNSRVGYIVAAAGNHAEPRQARPRASYPASDPSIISVGALKKHENGSGYEAADYSDSPLDPDLNPIKGVWTLGGDYDDTRNGDETRGIIGVSTLTDTGYAWWAGTSFATPVVSGTLAVLLSRGAGVAAKAQLLGISHLENVITGNPAVEKSFVLDASQ